MSSSASILRVVFFSGGIAVTLSILFLFFAVILHILNQRKEDYLRRFSEQMRPYLMKAVFEEKVELPVLSKKEKIALLDLWNRIHPTLKGPAKEKLNRLAYQNRLDQLAFSLFQKRGFYKKMLAIWTLGHLKEKRKWDQLLQLLNHPDSYLSLAAAQSLLRIDPHSSIPFLIPFWVKRKDWPPTKVVMMLKENETVEINRSLAQFFAAVPADRIPLFLRYLEMIWSPALSPIVRQVLNSTSDPEIISTGLRLLRTPDDLPTIRHYLFHPSEPVRVQATKALGRVGTEEDIPSLVSLLSDGDWWIRYQAANALARFGFVGMEKLKKIREEQKNPLAQEILTFVIAEREFG